MSHNPRGTQDSSTDEDTDALESSQQAQKVEEAHLARNIPLHRRIWKRWCDFYGIYSFVILTLCAILLAFAYPPLGAVYLAPEITASWIAVMFIFVLAGLGIKTEELTKALTRHTFNIFIQIYNFGVVSGIVYGFSRFMVYIQILPQSLADGMIICSSLPMTINTVIVLTKTANGDEAAAIFNATFGSLVGVFLSPLLILGYLGVKGEVDLGDTFFKLGIRVLLPLLVGQLLQKFVAPAKEFVKKYKKYFKMGQEYSLVFIVYTVFCTTFSEESNSAVSDVFLMIALQLVILCFVMLLAWFSLCLLFPTQPKLQAMGLYGCTHKTVALGIPLINTIYGSDPLVGMYTLPLLIWHPMQLVLGSAVAPSVASYVTRKEEELAKQGNSPDLEGETVGVSESMVERTNHE